MKLASSHSTGCGCLSQNNRGVCGPGIVVADEAVRLHGVIRTQVMCPAKTDRLVPEFDFHMKRTLRVAKRYGIADQVPGIGEVRIVRGIATDGNIFVRG